MPKTPWCPLIGEECMEHGCAWYINIQGVNPQDGKIIDQWQCAIAAIPMLQIETSQAARATQSATVEVREEINKATQATVMAALNKIQPAQINLLE